MCVIHRTLQIQSTVFPHYNGAFKNQNKNAHSHRIGRYTHYPPLVSIAPGSITARANVLGPRHRRMQAQGEPQFMLYYMSLFRHFESFESLALVCWQISCLIQWLRELHVAGLRRPYLCADDELTSVSCRVRKKEHSARGPLSLGGP